MGRHIVNTLLNLAFLVTVNCGAAEQAVSKPSDKAVFPTKKTPNVVSEPPVPLLPTVSDEVTYLIEAGRIPRLRDELGSGKHRIRLNVPQYRRIRQHLARLTAPEDRRQIESEAVHMHLLDPIAETVHDHPAND